MEISAVLVPGTASRRLHCPPSRPDHHHVRRSPLLLLCLDRKSPSFLTSSIRPHSGAVSACVTRGTASWSEEEVVPSREENESPTSVPLEPIANEEQFNRVIAEAHRLELRVIILWLASWCRKCIYLKPKLERLAADYYPSIRFYSIDVNTVPQRLVNRAGVTKMPTIQLWKDSKLQNEVIAGYKAWMAVDDIRKMIENEE
ncbi:thioredoxin-like 3-2, chloroplastic [Zingiber officinale]|uniref:thioredoxin-like 3-2, chloroplastic n=1 Tax=Zingiber officinale TaxID=94328 RepID=UPI001C4B3E55|nr:thioredoxin-like 3-2, chloroplastic [Zingiber officinale]